MTVYVRKIAGLAKRGRPLLATFSWPLFHSGLSFSLICCGCNWALGEETFYSDRYSNSGFRQIELGMTRDQVGKILGDPLEKRHVQASECWVYYASKNSPNVEVKNGGIFRFTYPINSSTLYFSQSGVVTNVSGEFLAKRTIDLKMAEVLELVGEPVERHRVDEEEVYAFSKPGATGTYKVREIVFNNKGTVTAKRSFVYYD